MTTDASPSPRSLRRATPSQTTLTPDSAPASPLSLSASTPRGRGYMRFIATLVVCCSGARTCFLVVVVVLKRAVGLELEGVNWEC
jgi:hypothetical protein